MMSKNGRDTETLAPTPLEARIPRRRFLTLTVLGAVAATWPTTSNAATAAAVQTLAAPALLTMVGSDRAVHLGTAYRQLVPAENDARVLIRAILAPSHRSVSPDLGAALSEQVTQDFTHGRTVAVDGWILAVTEARQCALYSLHAA